MHLASIMCNNLILIVPSLLKDKIIKEIGALDNIYSYKIYSFNEFKKEAYFDYDLEAIYYLVNKYNLKEEIAKEMLESFYFLKDINYYSEKLNRLLNYKKELKEKGLLKENKLFNNLLINKKIVVYGYDLITLEIKKTLEPFNVTYVLNEKENNYKPTLYAYETLEEEVEGTCYLISKLLENNISPSQIKIANLSNDYFYTFKRYLAMYNLPLVLENKTPLYFLPCVQKFYQDVKNNLNLQESLNTFYNENKDNLDLYYSLLNVCNKFVSLPIKEALPLLKTKLKETNKKEEKYENSIELIDLENINVETDSYIFALSFNQGIFPKSYKNEEFLSDDEKLELGIDTSEIKNINAKKKFKILIDSTPNLVLSYKEKSPFNTFSKSFLINEFDLKENHLEIDYTHSYSSLSDKLKLAKIYDKISEKNNEENINILASNYELNYKTYDHQFKNFDSSLIVNYINKSKINMSYSALNTFYLCSFQYYLNSLLKLNTSETKRGAVIGTAFHAVLEQSLKDKDFDFDEAYNNESAKINDIVTLFYLKKLKPVLKEIINIDNKNMENSKLNNFALEKEIKVNYTEPFPITFKGFIDKLMYNDDKNYAAIIDYKTGPVDINVSLVDYGLSMQLPIYLYLIKHTEDFKDAKVCGFYLEHLIPKNYSANTSLVDAITKTTKLEGYSNSSLETLSYLDPFFSTSTMIKGMRLKNDGTFYDSANVLSDTEMNEIANKVENKIKEALKEISKCNFKINPKKLEGNNISCTYCEFKDCCFMNNNDFIYYGKEKEEEE